MNGANGDGASPNGKRKGKEVEVPDLEKPETARSNEDQGADQDGQEYVSAFSNKRLCERWLGQLTCCLALIECR
jgi:hypothetical protein